MATNQRIFDGFAQLNFSASNPLGMRNCMSRKR